MRADNVLSGPRQSLLSRDSAAEQAKVLLRRIVAPNVGSEYGRTHDFAGIRDVRDFQKSVPICDYEAFRPYIDRMTQGGEQSVLVSEPVRRFFITSGSTASPKYVPVTASFIRDKWRGFQTYWELVRQDHPTTVGGGVITNFSDGSRESTTPAGLLCGSESSFWNSWGRGPNSTVGNGLPHEVCRIADPTARYYTIARVLIERHVSALMVLNPSTMLLLLQTLNEFAEDILRDVERGGLSPGITVDQEVRRKVGEVFDGNPELARRLREMKASNGVPFPARNVWPNLDVVISWRSPMVHGYIELLSDYLGPVSQRDYILMASEGVIAIPFEDGVSGGALATDIHFYEFIPEECAELSDPPTLLAHELEVGKQYVTVLSTSAGLYRFNLGDVLRVKEMIGSTPVLEFLHRIGRTCSLTGEKLTEDQVARAVSAASSRTEIHLQGFTMCPASKPFPHYGLIVELTEVASSQGLSSMLLEVDRELGRTNMEYKAKRESQRLGAPELWVARAGSFAEQRRRRAAAGVSDAQIKPACLTRDEKVRTEFEYVDSVLCASAQ